MIAEKPKPLLRELFDNTPDPSRGNLTPPATSFIPAFIQPSCSRVSAAHQAFFHRELDLRQGGSR